MARPTFTASPDVVCIHVQGVPNPKGEFYVPDDQNLVVDFLDAMHRNELPRAAVSRQSGGGIYIGYFYKEDVDKIIRWLETRSDRVDQHPPLHKPGSAE